MAIAAADLKFIAAARMTDDLSQTPGVGGGGRPSDTLIVDAAQNNVFADVMPSERVTGAVQLRCVYPSVLSVDNDSLSNAMAGLIERPTDANVEVCAFRLPPGFSQTLDNNLAGFAQQALTQVPYGVVSSGTGAVALGSNDVTSFAGSLPVGTLIELIYSPVVADPISLRHVTAVGSGTFTFSGAAAAAAGTVVVRDYVRDRDATFNVHPSAVSHLSGAVSAAATVVPVDRLWVTVKADGTQLPLYFAGDAVLIQDATTPATRELAVVLRVDYSTSELVLAAGLANAYVSGSKLTQPIELDLLKARILGVPFVQQTWTRTWADVAAGASISARYSGTPELVNAGAVTDRWAAVFTSTTQFDLLSEQLGQIASGNVATDFLPLNPMTNEPFVVLRAAAWGGGWLPGNVLRFNTQAANAPLWLARCTKPSAAGGTEQCSMFLRGDVNA